MKEWKDKDLQFALIRLNNLLTAQTDVEQTAYAEAMRVASRLRSGAITRAEVIDYLVQHSIDLSIHLGE